MPSAIFEDIAVITQGRDITRNWIEPLLSTTDTILATKGGYDLSLYEEVIRDEQVQSCYQQRFGGLTSCEWEVKAGGDRRVDAKAADSLREMLSSLAWDDINTKHLYALHYGYSVAECMWGRDGQQVYLKDIRVRNRRRFRFDEKFGLRLLTWRDQFVGELMPDQKFWTFCVGADHHDEPYGKGLGHWLYWLSYFKRNDMRVWLRYLEKFSQPTTTVEYPPGMPDEQQDTLLKAAIAVANSTAVKLPQGAKLAFLEAARSGTADYSALWDACNEGISKVILSQTMTTDNGSSLSQAQVHEGVARRVIKSDADLICNSFNNSVAKWLTDWNYPGAAYPKVWRNTEAESDLKIQAERDKILFDMGFVPAQSYIQESYGDGFALPGEDTPAGLNGTQLDSILQIVDAIQSGTLTPDIGQELITLAVPSVSADIAMRIATPPEPAAIAAASSTPPPTIDVVATQFAEGDYEYAAKKSSKGAKQGAKNCKKGINCGGTCISAKKTCKQNMSPAQAAKTKAVKPKVSKGGGGGGGTQQPDPNAAAQVAAPVPPPPPEPTTAVKLAEALAAGDFDTVLASAIEVQAKGYELATVFASKNAIADIDSIFDEGIRGGNGTNSDWIMKAIAQDLGYDALPKKLDADGVTAAVNAGGLEIFRAPTSNPATMVDRVAEFTDGVELPKGRGIYGHGLYFGAVKPGLNRQDGINAALGYGPGMIRASYTGKTVKQSEIIKEMNADLAKIDSWHEKKRADVIAKNPNIMDEVNAKSREVDTWKEGKPRTFTDFFGDKAYEPVIQSPDGTVHRFPELYYTKEAFPFGRPSYVMNGQSFPTLKAAKAAAYAEAKSRLKEQEASKVLDRVAPELAAADKNRENLKRILFGDSTDDAARYPKEFYDFDGSPSARYAALKGYDGIDIDMGYDGAESYFVLLNRGAVQVQDGVFTGK
jgi:hypothetical protein